MMYVCVTEDKKTSKLPKGVEYIYVGKKTKIDSTKIYDNTGENIADLNNSFCELTALYWIWKNSKEKYKGLCHYRRKFFNNYFLFYKVMSEKQLLTHLSDYDIILPYISKQSMTSYELYKRDHDIKDLDFCLDYILKQYPEYSQSVEWYKKSKDGYYCNIFYCRAEIFDDYAEWLFPILFELKKANEFKKYINSYQDRVYGFLAERLFNIYLHKNNFKIKNLELKVSKKNVLFRPYLLVKLNKFLKTK